MAGLIVGIYIYLLLTIAMLELNLTPRVVAEVEQKLKKGITQILADGPSVLNTLAFIEASEHVKSVDADTILEKELLGNRDINVIFFDIMEQLQNKGFLSKELQISSGKKDLQESMNTNSSDNSGKKEKKVQ